MQSVSKYFYLIFLLLILFNISLFFGYALAENIEVSTPEFAANAETIVYQVKYNDKEVIKDKLALENVELNTIDEKDLIIVRVLPDEIEEIEEKIRELDSKNHPFQVKYNIYMVELCASTVKHIGLKELEVNPEKQFQLFTQKKLNEIAGSGIISYFIPDIDDTYKKRKKTADSTLITGINSTASLLLNEQVLSIDGEIATSDSFFNLQVTPKKIHKTNNEIKTLISLEAGSEYTSKLSTSVWTYYDEPELIGVFTRKKNYESRSNFSTRTETEKQYFALYLNAQPVPGSIEDAGMDIFELKNAKDFFFIEEEEFQQKDELTLFFNSDNNYDIYINVQSPEQKKGFEVKVKDIDGIHGTDSNFGGNTSLSFGPDIFLIDELKLGIRGLIEDDRSRIKLGVNERVRVNQYLILSAGYYPLFYEPGEYDLTHENYWWFEGELQDDLLFLNMRYSEYKKESTQTRWRILLGCRLGDNLSVMGGFSERELMGGIRFEY